MTPREYWTGLSADAKRELADKCDTSVGHLSNVFCCGKKCGEDLAIKLELFSAGAVICESLRDDVPWHVLRGSTKDPKDAAKRKYG